MKLKLKNHCSKNSDNVKFYFYRNALKYLLKLYYSLVNTGISLASNHCLHCRNMLVLRLSRWSLQFSDTVDQESGTASSL